MRKISNRRLQFEALESRQVMAAGITASLAGSVLTVVGTDDSDSILFQQSSGRISIVALSGSWSANKVKSIVINLHGGDDVVSLNSLANGGSKSLSEAVTVISGAGTERVGLAKGQEIEFDGAGNRLNVSKKGAASLNGIALNLGTTPQISFKSGVLTITSSNAGETFNFVQTNGRLGLQGRTQSWAASTVRLIVVNLQGGDDCVSLQSLANGGNQSINVEVIINTGAGNERITFANGQHRDFTGYGHQVRVSPAGVAKYDGQTIDFDDPPPPDPPVTNWFDANIQDVALRTLGKNLYIDGLLDRSDMLALFSNAGDGGVVDATEFQDLQAIVNNSTLFDTLESVRKLSSYIVSGNTANALYQGQALGNLAAGSTAGALNDLVNKWFLGLDRPTTPYGYALASGTLFVNGPSYADIAQGFLNNCGFMASLAETAHRSPSTITNMFVVNGDGTYAVRFYHGGVAEYVTVDSYLPGGGDVYARTPNGELWAALAEKAYVQVGEMSWFGRQNNYKSIEYLFVTNVLSHITGQTTVGYTRTFGPNDQATFAAAYSSGKLICLVTYVTPPSNSVVGSHAYAVVGYDVATQTVTLFNPWGIHHGLTALAWSDVQANFSYFDRTA